MSLSEWATRKQHVDRALTEAGWTPIIPHDDHASRDLVVFEEYPTASGPADYALFHNGEPLAVVEAKKLGVGPQVVPLAPLAEQRRIVARIVARIEALFAQANILEAQVAATRRWLEQVDQAILARAFRGELVEQDPEDEPAEVLLERIRTEQDRRG